MVTPAKAAASSSDVPTATSIERLAGMNVINGMVSASGKAERRIAHGGSFGHGRISGGQPFCLRGHQELGVGGPEGDFVTGLRSRSGQIERTRKLDGIVSAKPVMPGQFLDEVRLFARTEFLTALFQGNALAPAERDRLALRLGELVGLPADVYAANNLRITKDRFRIEFLKDKNEVLGQYDGRYKTTAAKDGKTSEASGVIFPAVNNGSSKYAKEDLLIEETNYVKDSPVKDLEGWKWGGTTPFSDWPYMASINDVMARNPNFRVVIGVGYHDFTTTTGATEYAVAQSGWPKDRVRIAHYDGGHMAYSIEKSLKELMEDVRALISGK